MDEFIFLKKDIRKTRIGLMEEKIFFFSIACQ